MTLRHALPADDEFLFAVYASTRRAEMDLLPWTALQKQAFLHMQFSAQRRSYLNEFPQAQTYVIEHDGQPAGRIIVDRSGQAILLMDIALLPEQRGQGLGTALLRALLAEAAASGRPVRLHVEDDNPAVRLYERLGFIKTGVAGFYSEMTRRPEAAEHA